MANEGELPALNVEKSHTKENEDFSTSVRIEECK